MIGRAKAGLLQGLVNAANDAGGGFAGTGDVDLAGGTAIRGAMGLAAKIPFVGGALGLAATDKTLGRAEARVGGSLADLARQGLVVSDEMIQQDLDVVIAQEKRATEVEARVKGISGSDENVASATPDAVIKGMEKLVTLGEDLLSLLQGIVGGSSR